eukprot:CAMPEP_0179170770 /NCGR_PEP_ID=MMETSP0796-20121207/84148_1 /TAXON_ID=73915 /ORGANISM="Pyrodinium bahamense, Strain pbaha01" /LENGTH=68 /DNA_ID=CAMNT_0020873785 /DNA_START=14 /DNA_END=217 /DNA_ORIENTATION=-
MTASSVPSVVLGVPTSSRAPACTSRVLLRTIWRVPCILVGRHRQESTVDLVFDLQQSLQVADATAATG